MSLVSFERLKADQNGKLRCLFISNGGLASRLQVKSEQLLLVTAYPEFVKRGYAPFMTVFVLIALTLNVSVLLHVLAAAFGGWLLLRIFQYTEHLYQVTRLKRLIPKT